MLARELHGDGLLPKFFAQQNGMPVVELLHVTSDDGGVCLSGDTQRWSDAKRHGEWACPLALSI